MAIVDGTNNPTPSMQRMTATALAEHPPPGEPN
jgi:hypothetical protein